MKIESFLCETFCTNTRSAKEANGNSEVEVKSAYAPRVYQASIPITCRTCRRIFCVFQGSRGEREAKRRQKLGVREAPVACEGRIACSAGYHSNFCCMKRLKVFLVPPGWDFSPSQYYPKTLICQYLFIRLKGYQSMSPKNTMQCSQTGLESILLEIEKQYKNQITGCLHRLLITFKMDNN